MLSTDLRYNPPVPIYEYCCADCQHVFETIVLRPSARVACPACGTENVERRPSTFAVAGSQREAATSGAGTACGGCRRSSCAGCH